MPTRHLRVCEPCNRWRYAECCPTCRVPDSGDRDSWELNPAGAQNGHQIILSGTTTPEKG